jgi:hypothetical protein
MKPGTQQGEEEVKFMFGFQRREPYPKIYSGVSPMSSWINEAIQKRCREKRGTEKPRKGQRCGV